MKISIGLWSGALLISGLLLVGCNHEAPMVQDIPVIDGVDDGGQAEHTLASSSGKVVVGTTMTGLASWYGSKFHGKLTSSGERYNMYDRTAAHRTWPMGTMVKVTNLDNRLQTIVRINDRGPFVKGRIIDCSYQAAKDIGLDRTGTARVKLEVIGFADGSKPASSLSTPKPPHTSVAKTQQSSSQHPVYQSSGTHGIQVGAFRNYSGAQIRQQEYNNYGSQHRAEIKKVTDGSGMPLYRVILKGFHSKSEAEAFKSSHGISGVVL